MRAVLLVAMLGIPLAGCSSSLSSLSLPSGKSVPEWAKSAQAGDDTGSDATTVRPKRAKTARRAAPSQFATREDQTGTPPTNSSPASMLPQSREYREREEALEERLRRRMTICNGC